MSASPPREGTRRPWWYVAVALFSAGLLTAIPLAHAAARTRRRFDTAGAVVAALLAVGVILLLALAPEDSQGHLVDPWKALLGQTILALFLGGTAATLHLVTRSRPTPDPPPSRPAEVRRALDERALREESRRLVADDPLVARELRIGRPDLAHTYRDGGLVDLATAPVEVIARVCDIDPGHAAEIAAARDAAGAALMAVDDLVAWVDVPLAVWEQVRDRGVVLWVTGS